METTVKRETGQEVEDAWNMDVEESSPKFEAEYNGDEVVESDSCGVTQYSLADSSANAASCIDDEYDPLSTNQSAPLRKQDSSLTADSSKRELSTPA